MPVNPALLGSAAAGRMVRAGELAQGDAALRTGELYDTHTFTWAVGQRVGLRLSSDVFDPYLIVRAPSGQQADNDDLEPGTTGAGLDYVVSEAGVHSVLVTSYQPAMSGAYTLEVTGEGGEATSAPTPGAEVIRGTLDAQDRADRNGKRIARHRVRLRQGEAVRIELLSSDFDTVLLVQPPGGQPIENDDAERGQTNSAVDLVARRTGLHTLVVTSYRAGEQGAYELRLVRAPAGTQVRATPLPATPVAPTPPSPTPRPGRPRPGAPPAAPAGTAPIEGALAQGDQQLRSGELVDNFTLEGQVGETVHLRLTSTAFDPYVIVRMPSGRQEDNDDLTPSTRDAGLDLTLTEAGVHTVMVTSYRPGESGAYALVIQRGGATPGVGPTGPDAPVRQPPGLPATAGRVFGIFAGITDYATQSDLAECANDARKLAEDLRRTGLMTPETQVLLTDNQVTTGALRDAFARVAREMTPQDTFVFFFSGHGGQRPAQGDANELDRQDETIVLYDGELVDNEMAQLFDRVPGRLNLIALDSCFSGGFAKDVISQEHRMGLFSSEEDLTSSVAGQFQAGGYLSHFLRMGIGGEADATPRDGSLTAGELSHYLFRQFGAHVGDVGATDQNYARSFQHLVVDSGSGARFRRPLRLPIEEVSPSGRSGRGSRG